MRGVSSIVAIVVITMMTLAIAGGAFAWISGIVQQQQSEASEIISTDINLRGASCTPNSVSLAVSNTGETTVDTASVNVFVRTLDGSIVAQRTDVQFEDLNLEKGETSTMDLYLPNTLKSGNRYDVVVDFRDPEYSVSSSCKVEGALGGLVGEWSFDSGVNPWIEDGSGFDNDGTLRNTEGYYRLEVGRTTASSSWTTVNLQNNYNRPVIATLYNESNNGGPTSVRIRNVGNGSFDVRLKRASSSGSAVSDAVEYMVAEEGFYTLSDGTRVEAGRYQETETEGRNCNTGTSSHTFTQSFSSAPVVLDSLMTYNDPLHATAHAWAISSTDFTAAMEASEACDAGLYTQHGPEDFGWIAIEEGVVSSLDGVAYETGITPDQVNGHDNECYPVALSGSYPSPPIGFGEWINTHGGDGGWYVRCGYAPDTLGVHIEEDTFADGDNGHTDTVGAWAVFESPFAQSVEYPAGDNGYGMALDGVDDFIEVPDDASLDLSGAFRVSLWATPGSVSSGGVIMAKGTSPSTNYGIGVNPTGTAPEHTFYTYFEDSGGNMHKVSGTTQLQDGQGYYVTSTWNGTHLSLLVDGSEENTQKISATPATNGESLIIGSDGGVSSYFQGRVDSIQVYDTASVS